MKKEQLRHYPMFSLCGLNCGCCTLQLGGHCPGCGAPGRPSCRLLKCAVAHGNVKYCCDCAEYPCERMSETTDTVSFVTCRHRLKDLEQLREIGPEAFEAIQDRKQAILKTLLENFNDGRRKSFYSLAITLLPLADCETVMTELKIQVNASLTLKEKALIAVQLFQDCAGQAGIILKRNTKEAMRAS